MKCIELKPDHYGANLHLANLLVDVNSVPIYKVCIKKKPNDFAPHLGLIVATKKNSKRQLKDTLKQDPDNFEVLTQLAILFLLGKKDANALQLLHRALTVNNNYIPALIALGQLMQFWQKYDKAKQCYEKVLITDRNNLSALKGMVQTCVELRLTDQAFECFWQVLKISKDLTV